MIHNRCENLSRCCRGQAESLDYMSTLALRWLISHNLVGLTYTRGSQSMFPLLLDPESETIYLLRKHYVNDVFRQCRAGKRMFCIRDGLLEADHDRDRGLHKRSIIHPALTVILPLRTIV